MSLGDPDLMEVNNYRIYLIQKLLCLTRAETDAIRFIDQRGLVLSYLNEYLKIQ